MFSRKRKEFRLDHSYETRNDSDLSPPFSVTEQGMGDEDGDLLRLMESSQERKRRYFSVGVMSFTAFTFNLAFSIVLTSAYPYLIQMEDGVDPGKDFLGYVIAAQPLGQLIFSPLMGYLGNRFGSVRYLSMTTMTILCCGFVFYACIHALPPPRKWYLVISRFLIGAAAGTFTLCFSYLAKATTTKERTTAFSLLSLGGGLAFIFGPAVQLLFAQLGPDNVISMGSNLYFNSYTGPAWFSACLALVNLFFLSPVCFTEYDIVKKESEILAARMKENASDEQPAILKKPDVWMLVAVIYIQSASQFAFIFLETLGTAMTTDMLGWNETEAITLLGFAFAGAGVYSIFLYASMGWAARKIGERNVLLIGLILITIGPVAMFPYSGPIAPIRNGTMPTTLSPYSTTPMEEQWAQHLQANSAEWIDDETQYTLLGIPSGNELGGCPADTQPWCLYTPGVTLTQFIIGFFLIVTGYPFANAISNSLFSKILGPYPQGTWMGALTAGGCVSRTVSPILVSLLYQQYGPRPTFGFMFGISLSIIVLILCTYRRLIPYQYETKPEPNKY